MRSAAVPASKWTELPLLFTKDWFSEPNYVIRLLAEKQRLPTLTKLVISWLFMAFRLKQVKGKSVRSLIASVWSPAWRWIKQSTKPSSHSQLQRRSKRQWKQHLTVCAMWIFMFPCLLILTWAAEVINHSFALVKHHLSSCTTNFVLGLKSVRPLQILQFCNQCNLSGLIKTIFALTVRAS